MKEVFASFIKSLERLEDILKAEKTIANRDSAIKRFELTAELAWKSIKEFLLEQKIFCRSPKECLKEAYKLSVIEDDAGWLAMMDERNITVHTYNEKIAEEVYGRLPKYLGLFNALKEKLDRNI